MVLAALSGVLIFLSFPPADLGWLAWIALVPLLLAVHGAPPSRAFGRGFLAGGVAFAGIVSWIRVYGLPAWVLLSAYLALYVGAFATIHRWLSARRSPAVQVWLVPLLWTALEYLRSTGVFGFPWALLGLTQHGHLAVIQVARYGGVFAVSFFVALTNGAIAAALQHRRLRPAVVPLLVLAVAIAWGGRQLPGSLPGTMPVAAIQPNVFPRGKLDPARAPQTMQTLTRLMREAGNGHPALIVLPETAVPKNLFGPAGAIEEVGRWAQATRATLVASSLENGTSNIAVAVAPSGVAVDRYDKVHLVAFGEAGITPGTRHTPLWTPAGRIGVAICFESIFPDVARTLIRNGAEVLAVITNDGVIANPSRLDGASGPAQHAAQAPLRAVETGRWVIRAANTGTTMLVDPSGRVRAALPTDQAAVLAGNVGLSSALTPYVQWGDVFSLAAIAAVIAVSLPTTWPALRHEWRLPEFRHALAAAGLPAVAMWALLQIRAPLWLWAGVLLGFVAVFSLARAPGQVGLGHRRFGRAAFAGIATVMALWVVMVAAYRAQQIPLGLIPPPDGWAEGALRQGFIALALEGWLRGVAFGGLLEWKGPLAAIVLTTVLGIAMQTGLPAEAVAWAMVSGAAFGLIRAWTGNALGLVIPHALGNLLVLSIFMVR